MEDAEASEHVCTREVERQQVFCDMARNARIRELLEPKGLESEENKGVLGLFEAFVIPFSYFFYGVFMLIHAFLMLLGCFQANSSLFYVFSVAFL